MDLASVFQNAYWATAALHYTDDFREGVDAFVEHRPARFGATEAESVSWDVRPVFRRRELTRGRGPVYK